MKIKFNLKSSILLLFLMTILQACTLPIEKTSTIDETTIQDTTQQEEIIISFETNGANSIDSVVLQDDTKLPIPEKAGHTFLGWFIDQALTQPYHHTLEFKESLTVYASWQVNHYEVTIHTFDEEKTIQVAYGEVLELPTVDEKIGYTFLGWYTDATFNTPYQEEDVITEPITIYENWVPTKNLYRVFVTEHIQEAVTEISELYEFEPLNLLPSKGESNVLVVPIEFPNDTFTEEELVLIEEGFFWDGSRFESLQTYYEKSSYGALTISGEVLPPVQAKYRSNYYENYLSYDNYDASGVDLLIEEAIQYYSKHYPELDLSPYDQHGDGVIDGIHFVYSVPMSYDWDSIYWAYLYYYMPTQGFDSSDRLIWNDYVIDAYIFSSIEFFTEDQTLNAWTIIHETGHLLGLEDYYDYTDDKYNYGGLGGADMMDHTIGDHNAFSKLLLDWIDPIVVTDSVTLTIDAFESSGDAIIITDEWTTLFDEYFMLSYYTPTGLNESNDYLTQFGLIIYDVNATLPTETIDDEYFSYFKYNNSTTKEMLIQMIEADGNDSIMKTQEASNSDMLQLGDSITLIDLYYEVTLEVVDQTATTITIDIEFH